MTTQAQGPTSLDDLYSRDTPEPVSSPVAGAEPVEASGANPAAAQPDAADPAKGEPAAGSDKGAPPASTKEAKPEGDWVPLKALQEERRKRQQLEKEFASRPKQPPEDNQKKPGRPDPLVDPDGFAQAIRDEQFVDLVNDTIEDKIEEVGEEKFDAAGTAFKQAAAENPILAAKLRRSRNPGEFIFREGTKHLEQKAEKVKGNPGGGNVDVAALTAQIEAKLRAELGLAPTGQAQAPAASPASAPAAAPRPSVPKSLAGMQSAAPRSSAPAAPAAKSFEQLYD